MNIKKIDDKPMTIRTKGKTKLHIKGNLEAKNKGRNILVAAGSPKSAGGGEIKENLSGKKRRSVARKIETSGKAVRAKTSLIIKTGATCERKESSEGVHKSALQKNIADIAREKTDSIRKRNKENTVEKKHDALSSVASMGTKMVLDQTEGGEEVYQSYLAARNLSQPLENATVAGRQLYRKKTIKAKAERLKRVQAEKKIRKKTVKNSGVRTAKEALKPAKREVKENVGTGTRATIRAGGILNGVAAKEAGGRGSDGRNMKNTTRNRMIQLFLSRLRQEDSQDGIGKALKDIVMMRVSMLTKQLICYAGVFLLGLFVIAALIALPVIIVVAVIYNSPFAIFFPSISSSETTQQVLTSYISEFNADVDLELTQTVGYDKSEKVYVDFSGYGVPDNFYDILAVYMVKHGNGDTATDMTEKAKKNLKKIIDDMCGYSVTSGTETETDENGNVVSYTVKYVNVTLRTYQDMIPIYGFDTEEKEMLAELMKPEILAMFGCEGSGGEIISPEHYQAIVDSVSDANGKKVVEYVLSKVGYPYSQALRDSGEYFDCSSLAYYAWLHAGVNIAYQGANTAAYEGKLCHDNNWMVHYGEMQPGDLIFYSFEKNGRFRDISHVAVYVGDGNVVEAVNARIGVVYRSMQDRNSIVMIGRPR